MTEPADNGLPGRLCFVEFKTRARKQTGPQKKFQEAVEQAGHDYVVIKSSQEFIYYISDNYGLRI